MLVQSCFCSGDFQKTKEMKAVQIIMRFLKQRVPICYVHNYMENSNYTVKKRASGATVRFSWTMMIDQVTFSELIFDAGSHSLCLQVIIPRANGHGNSPANAHERNQAHERPKEERGLR